MLKIVFFLFAAVFCYGDVIEDAQKLVDEKKTDEAVKLYADWLDNNGNSKEFFDVMKSALELTDDINKSMTMIEKYIPDIKITSDLKEAIIKLGGYAELSGNFLLAQQSYIKASEIDNNTDFLLVYRSAVLLHYMGEYSRSEVQIMRILRNCKDENLVQKATILLAKSFLARGDKEGFDELKKEIAGYDDNENTKQSPEYLLKNGKIEKLPDIDSSLGLLKQLENNKELDISKEQQESRFLVQTGSFLDRENAEYLSRDLNKLGFEAFVEQQSIDGKLYNKVFINADSVEDARNLILKLKDKGYEGYPVY